MDNLPISFRPATSDDYGYILSTWTQNYHKVQPTNFIPNSIYFPHQTEVINKLLNRCGAVIACIDDEPDQIVGYLVAEQFNDANIILHWGNVKSVFRRMGVMKELLKQFNHQDKNIICTHYFDLFKKLKDSYYLVYDPTILEDLL